MWLFSIFTEKSFPATLTVINKHEKIMMQTEMIPKCRQQKQIKHFL